MSWHFSQALVAASSVDTSSDGGASAPSNTTTMPAAFSWQDRTTGASRRSRYGMTCEPLTDARGEDVLTWCLAGSPARTSAQPARVQASAVHDPACGPRWRALSVRFSPNTSGWRTAHSLFGEDLAWSSLILPRWGSLRGGELWGRTTQAPLTSETGSGCWPTPTASSMPCEGTQRLLRKKWLAGELSLEEASAIAGRDVRKSQGKVPKWPTPTADDANNVTRKSGEFKSLTRAVMFPTPCATKARQGFQNRRNGKKGSQESLTTVVQGGPASEVGGALNPTWVEWLMGWPLGWTDCGASATDRFREWCNAHGRSCHND